MATFLDIALLENFSTIFSFVLVFVIAFGITEMTKLFGESKMMHALLAFCVSFLTLLSPTSLTMIRIMSPWFIVLFFFAVFLIMMYKLFGASDHDLQTVIQNHTGVQYTILVAFILIIIIAFGFAQGQRLLEAGSGTTTTSETSVVGVQGQGSGSVASSDAMQNAYRTIFHPKVLGLIFMLAISIFTIIFLSQAGRAPWPGGGGGGH
ncbi:hypothetical protein HZB02_06075 [Candidatus Woesearchaeota archaeon]|nr:hypothetical protein [Candidatus Woesearchaeota archaeon]